MLGPPQLELIGRCVWRQDNTGLFAEEEEAKKQAAQQEAAARAAAIPGMVPPSQLALDDGMADEL